jgi:predicted urease superfamily metal-dependent hydrolase
VEAALSHITQDELVLMEILEITTFSLQENMQAAKDELDKLCHDEKLQPITYNHYYTDNIQNARQDATKKMIRKAMNETTTQDWNGKLHISNTTWDAAKLLASLQSRVTVNMDGQACAEALSGLHAYYKVRLQCA